MLLGSVLLNAIKELLTALGMTNVFDTNVNALLNNSVSYALVHLDTNGALGNVPDTASLSVVVLMGHPLVNGSVGLDIHNVSNLSIIT